MRCGTNVHKRSNEQAFQAFVQGQCLDQPYTQDHAGHSSHALWQKGNKATCTQCGITLHLDGQHRLILTAAVKKPCKGSGSQSSTPLTEIFRKQLEQASQSGSPDSSGDTSQQAPHESQALPERVKKPKLEPRWPPQTCHPEHPRPTPRRLHFQTDLDLQEQDPEHAQAAMAMNPSHEAARASTSSSRGNDAPPQAQATADELDSHLTPGSDPDNQPFTVEYF